jgi:hypothetical protein
MGDGSPRLNSKGKGRAPQNGDILALNLDSAEEGTASENGGAFQQMQLVEQQVRRSIVLFIYLHISLVPIPGHLHTIQINCNRINRVDHRRARPDIHPASHHGRRAARNSATHRCGHNRHCVERERGTKGVVEILC